MDGRITSRAGDPKSAARQHVSTGVIPHTSCPIPPPDIRRLETADQPPVWVRRRAAAGLDRRLAADLPQSAGQPAAYRGALLLSPSAPGCARVGLGLFRARLAEIEYIR